MKIRRFFNMYFTTTISVAMVLFLVGLECVVVLSARNLMRSLKQDLALTIVLTEQADSTEYARMSQFLDATPYSHSYQFISRQQALQMHVDALGEDPTQFLGYNPLSDSYELHLNEKYACADSLSMIAEQIKQLTYVDDVFYQQSLVEVLDMRLGHVSMMLLVCAAILLLVVWVLMVNTIRLHIYSKRFLINTMRLVGATHWTICSPFVWRSVRMGVEAAVLALLVIAAGVAYMRWHWGIMLFPWTWQNMSLVAAVVIGFGVVITFFASLFATSRYVRMTIDKMYEI